MNARWNRWLGVFFVVGALASAAFAAKEPALKIDVSLPDKTVELFGGEPPVAGRFIAVAKVRNETKSDLFLSEMTCSYLQDWKTNTPYVSPEAQTCTKNGPKPYVLKSGEVHQVPIPLVVSGDVPPGDIHFRLAYAAQQPGQNPDAKTTLLPGGPFWSDDITVAVRVASQAKQKHWHSLVK